MWEKREQQCKHTVLAWFLRVAGIVVLFGATAAVLDFTSLFAAESTVFLWGGVISDFGYRFATGAISLAAAELLLAMPPRS